MDGEQQFWVRIWTTVACAVVAVAIVCGANMGYSTYRVSEAIKTSGLDPLVVGCGMGAVTNEHGLCSQVVGKR